MNSVSQKSCASWVFPIFLTAIFSQATALAQTSQSKLACQSPLIDAVRDNNTGEIERIIGTGADLNARDCDGSTPLVEAINRNAPDLVVMLVSAGANVNAQASKKTSPLAVASWNCQLKIVAFLLSHGADTNAPDEDGETALMDSVVNCTDGGVTALLLRWGAKLNEKSASGSTALATAAFYGNEQAVHILVAAGADLSLKTDEGQTALTIARDREVGRKEAHQRIYLFLLDADAAGKTVDRRDVFLKLLSSTACPHVCCIMAGGQDDNS